RVVFDGRVVLIASGTKAFAGHVNIARSIKSYRRGEISAMSWAVVPCHPEFVTGGAVLDGRVVIGNVGADPSEAGHVRITPVVDSQRLATVCTVPHAIVAGDPFLPN